MQPKNPHKDPFHSITLATYNIKDGHNSHIACACGTLQQQKFDLAILSEARLIPSFNTRPHPLNLKLYNTISVQNSNTPFQGGIALVTSNKAKNRHIE
jgi:hypothetical protein